MSENIMPNQIIEAQRDSYALAGRIVTMNDAFDVVDDGILYIRQGKIHAVRRSADPVPDGFTDAPIINTGGIIFPGLIELHNHLSYNILPMWQIPQQFNRRSQWRNHPQKRSLVTAPMAVLGKTPGYPEAIVRYVECKCLVSGVTTSQGISLYGVGLKDYYRGIVRNVEAPTNPQLPKAHTKISDVDGDKVERFWERLQEINGTFLLHLCEGIDDKARRHFEALKLTDDTFAINDHLTGIHSTALLADDFRTMGDQQGAVVWSPLSNLLLYGATTNIQAAIDANVMIALGSDWSPTGSKNLLGELKVAKLVIEKHELPLTARDIVAMATSNPAKILKWDAQLGVLEDHKEADLLIIPDDGNDPYEALIAATEKDVALVLINGIPRFGRPDLMANFGPETEKAEIAGEERWFNLLENNAHEPIRNLTLQLATERLTQGLDQIVDLALALEDETNPVAVLARVLSDPTHVEDPSVFNNALAEFNVVNPTIADNPILLDLHEDEFEGFLSDEVLGVENAVLNTGLPDLFSLNSGASYSDIVGSESYRLDSLTIIDDADYFETLVLQFNLPNYIKEKLPAFYGAALDIPPVADFLTNTPDEVRPQFHGVTTLVEFMQQDGFLSLSERRMIIEQALLILEQFYVHLPLKQSMHAVNPVQRLRLMLFALDQQMVGNAELLPELEFHKELLTIFTSLRDLHTSYVLPAPYRGKVAFLPFLIEEYFDEEDSQWRYIISKIAGNYGDDLFDEPVEVLYWNGILIQRAIAINANRYAGSNLAARHARGLHYLTIRPLDQGVAPDEEWVTIHYKYDGSDEIYELRQDWLVFSPSLWRPTFHQLDEVGDTTTAMGLDWHHDTVHQVKKAVFVPKVIQAQHEVQHSKQGQALNREDIETTLPAVFLAKPINDRCGYIRVFTFNVPNARDFVREFVRLSEQLPEDGLIIDIRANPGGLIPAAECLLQALSPDAKIPVGRAQFINSSLTLELCRLHTLSPMFTNLKLGAWVESIEHSIRTGSIYSQAIPITDADNCEAGIFVKQSKKLLIVDALCYSSADIFAAGFQDHNIGEIIGTSDNTGAGGANVWDHELLTRLLSISELPHARLKPLPHNATIRVAIRRALRGGEREGMPIEDMGIYIKPGNRYRMSKHDLLDGNVDLLDFACQRLISYQ